MAQTEVQEWQQLCKDLSESWEQSEARWYILRRKQREEKDEKDEDEADEYGHEEEYKEDEKDDENDEQEGA